MIIEEQILEIFGNNLRSKIIVSLIKNNNITSLDLKRKINEMGKEYQMSIINEHLKNLKDINFIKYNKKGKGGFWSLNEANDFVVKFSMFVEPSINWNEGAKPNKRKKTDAWIELLLPIVKKLHDDYGHISIQSIEDHIDISKPRLCQILNEMKKREILVQPKVRGDYLFHVNFSTSSVKTVQ